MQHQAAIEAALFDRVRDLLGFEATVTLYDLTNTYFEGLEAGNPKAMSRQCPSGHSKEKRSDCPLLTLGRILDGSGFVRRSLVFAGNAVECRTLEGMLKQRSFGVGRHYEITLEMNAEGTVVTRLTWEQKPVAGTMLSAPGVYFLRSTARWTGARKTSGARTSCRPTWRRCSAA